MVEMARQEGARRRRRRASSPYQADRLGRPTTKSGRARRVGWYAVQYHLPSVRAEAGLAGLAGCCSTFWAGGAGVGGAKTDGMVAVVGEGPGEEAGL